MSLRLHLIRHGETEWSRSGQYTGRTDLSLTQFGEDAARDLGLRLRGIAFDQVLTSPLKRAKQTCALANLRSAAMIEPDLTEWDNGDYEGHFPEAILASRPGWNLFRDGAPHGESPQDICRRADRLIERLRLLEGNIALFSHGHFCRILAARWIGASIETAQHFLLSTGSLSVLCYEHDQADQPAIALWNSVANEAFDPPIKRDPGDVRPMKQRALERWENEGGEIPGVTLEAGGLHPITATPGKA